MRLWKILPRPYLIRPGVEISGVAVGSDGPRQSCFIVPIYVADGEGVDETAWGVRPTSTGRPRLVANSDPNVGWIMRLSTYTRPGKAVGQILVVENSKGGFSRLGYGVAGDAEGMMRWEEALVEVQGSVDFILLCTGPPDQLIRVTGTDIQQEELVGDWPEEDWLRIDDPRIEKFEGGKYGIEEKDDSNGQRPEENG